MTLWYLLLQLVVELVFLLAVLPSSATGECWAAIGSGGCDKYQDNEGILLWIAFEYTPDPLQLLLVLAGCHCVLRIYFVLV